MASRIYSPSYFVYEGDGGLNPPARPTLDQVGGAAFTNDTMNPPDPDQQPMAEDYNQINYIAYCASLMIPALVIGVTLTGTTMTLNRVIAINRNISLLTSANPDISFSRTSVGHYAFGVPVAKLPQMSFPPMAFANKAGAAAASAAWLSSGSYVVYTSDNTGLIDCSFVLCVSGY